MELQEEAVNEIEEAATSYRDAAKLFQTHGLGNEFRVPQLLLSMRRMLQIDFDTSPWREADFLRCAVILGVGHCLRDLKYRARIPVTGPTVIGVCDIWNILKEGEIYVKCQDEDGEFEALKGRFPITRR